MTGRAGKRAADSLAGIWAAVSARLAPDAAPGPDRSEPDLVSPEDALVPVGLPDAQAAQVEERREAVVPRWLRLGAGWAWRLLLLALLIYVSGRVISRLLIVVIPLVAAILLTALLQPLTARLRRQGLGPLSATWCSLLLAFVVIGGVIWLVTARIEAEYPTLVTQVRHTSTQIQSWLASSPLHIKTGNLDKVFNNLVTFFRQHRSTVEGAALTGGKIVVEVAAGIVLCLFISFFLIKDGERIWAWLISGMSDNSRRRANLAGYAAWQAVVHYVRGTVAVAAIHAVVMGITLTVVGSPLVAPLALFMFIAAFVPLVGVLIAGTVAFLIVLAAKGLLGAVVVLIVMVVMNQVEAHLLQPQVVGKMVHLHPLAVILVLAVAGEVASIPGAVVAVPVTAALTGAARALQADDKAVAAASRAARAPAVAAPRQDAAGPAGDAASGS